MTKQEQIEEIKQVLIKTCKRCRSFEEDYMQSKYAEVLYNAGYGNISEYRTEREMLGSQIKVLKQRLNDKYIEVDNLNRDYSNAFERLKSQQQEIERLKAENEELTKVVSSKVYDLIDNTKEIADTREAWEKQAKIDVLNELRNQLVVYHPNVISEIDELIKEIVK